MARGRNNWKVPNIYVETSLGEHDVFAVFDGLERQLVIRSLLARPTATLSELAVLTGGSQATVTKHVAILEDLGIVTLDIPKGARRGRTVNASLNRSAYDFALQVWLREMGAGV